MSTLLGHKTCSIVSVAHMGQNYYKTHKCYITKTKLVYSLKKTYQLVQYCVMLCCGTT